MQAEPRLLPLQRRFLAALREPIFGDSRGRSELPPRVGDVSPDFVRTAEALITPSATLGPVERLELYHRQYWYRLLDSIAEDFPALRRHLGAQTSPPVRDAAFWGLMEAYLEAGPPRSYTLRHLGAGLADFIAARPELVSHPEHAEDLARVEYAVCLAFEAGDAAPVSASELARGRLALQPHLSLLALRTPADTAWRAAQRGRSPVGRQAGGVVRSQNASGLSAYGRSLADTRPEAGRPQPPPARPARFAAVYRDASGLHVERLPRAAYSVLAGIRDHGSLDAALEHVLGQRGLLRARDAGRVAEWFGRWTSRGWFIRQTERTDP